MGVWYATRESVKQALDLKETARANTRVDEAIESASRSAEALLRRHHIAPTLATKYFDWPNEQTARSWRLWLDANEIISVTTLSSGGTTISGSDFNLEPNEYGPPYDRIELIRSSNAVFGGGDTEQRDITVTGLWGYTNNTTTVGVTAEALDGSEAGIDVDGSTAALVGVGSVLQIDSERFLVTERAALTTSQTLQTPLTSSTSNVTVAVTTGSAYALGEVILLDSEKMLIVDIAGNNLTVIRAWDGSVLAAHTGSTIYGYRTLTVTRGALGTTAATHSSGASILRWDPPGLVKSLVTAEAVNELLQQSSGYAVTVGSGESEREASGRALRDIRQRAYDELGRFRQRAV